MPNSLILGLETSTISSLIEGEQDRHAPLGSRVSSNRLARIRQRLIPRGPLRDASRKTRDRRQEYTVLILLDQSSVFHLWSSTSLSTVTLAYAACPVTGQGAPDAVPSDHYTYERVTIVRTLGVASRRAGPVAHRATYPPHQRSVPEGASARAALQDVPHPRSRVTT